MSIHIPASFLPVLAVLLLVAAGGAGFLGYRLYASESLLAEANERANGLDSELAAAREDNARLAEALDTEQRRNEDFQGQIDDIAGTVGVLDKLAKTDPELLQKYSKVYFLNENYMPERLTRVPDELSYNGDEEYFHAETWPFLENLIKKAADDGIELRIVSGFRSFDRQAELKNGYLVTYGSGANAFSADQGYSEHQLGTAVDFTTTELGASWSSAFGRSEAYAWLLKNAHRYGFILSYPPDNAYYQYEPWHWRFVGRELARDLHDDEKSFYDLDQREIDGYLIDLFD